MKYSPKELREVVKCKNPSGWYLENTMRKFSYYITWLLLHTSITANHITMLFISIYFIAGFFFIMNDQISLFIAAFLLQLGYLFDCVDGEIARGREEACISGSYLDKIAHVIVHPFIFFSVGFGIYISKGSMPALISGIVAAHAYTLDQCVRKFKSFTVMNVMLKYHENLNTRYDSFKNLNISQGCSDDIKNNTSPKTNFLKVIIKKGYYTVTDLNRSTAQMNVFLLAITCDFLLKCLNLIDLNISILFIALLYYACSYPLLFILNLFFAVRNNALDREYLTVADKISKIKF